MHRPRRVAAGRAIASRAKFSVHPQSGPMHTCKSIEQILSSYNDQAPLSHASTIPAPWYVDPRIAELERLNVFSKTWQLVARTSQLQSAGDYVSTRIAGEPIVVVRGSMANSADFTTSAAITRPRLSLRPADRHPSCSAPTTDGSTGSMDRSRVCLNSMV